MRVLSPYLVLHKRHKWMLLLGVMLAIVALLANISLLTLSGWFLSVSAVVGVAGIYSFNYMLPTAGIRGATITRTAGRYFKRPVSHDATFRVLQYLRALTFGKLLPLSPVGLARFCQGELLNRVVAGVDTLDHLYLRVISPLVGALVVIVVVTCGLSLLDVILVLTLDDTMLVTLPVMSSLFYRAGKPAGESMTQLCGQYRQQFTTWLQGQAELTVSSVSDRYRAQMEKTEFSWQDAQRRQVELIAFSQAVMLLIGGIAVVAMLWLASAGIGDSSQPGALIALFIFYALAASEVLAPVIGAFQHLGQVVAFARWVSQITGQQPEITFVRGEASVPTQVALTFRQVTFRYLHQLFPALENISLQIVAGEHIAILGQTSRGKSTLLQFLTRAWDLTQGEILLNDQPLSQLSEVTLRQTMSVVPQHVHLFSATLRDNLLLAAPDVDDTALCATLEKVGLEKLLEDGGLNSWPREGGRQLPGSELRRLAIARALLHDAPLTLPDESTEGLDAAIESQILHLLAEVMYGKIVLMVIHRLRGLMCFNQMIVMDNNQIIEQGSYADLLARQGRYFQFKQRLQAII